MSNQLENPERNKSEQEINLTEKQKWVKEKMFDYLYQGRTEEAILEKSCLPKELITSRKFQAEVKDILKEIMVKRLLSGEAYRIDSLKEEFGFSGDIINEAIQEAAALSDTKMRTNMQIGIKEYFPSEKISFLNSIISKHFPKDTTLNDLTDFDVRLKRSLYGHELNAFSFKKHIRPMIDVLGEESACLYFEGIKRILAILSEEDVEFITKIAISKPDEATKIMKEILLKVDYQPEIIEGYINEIGVANFTLYTAYKDIKNAKEKNDTGEIAQLRKGFEKLSQISMNE